MKPAAVGRLQTIDALRGVAVLAVLASHIPFQASATPTFAADGALVAGQYPLQGWPETILGYGARGVGLFLLISGFCIHLNWARMQDAPDGHGFRAFWIRRLRRLYPTYLAALGLTIVGRAVLYGGLMQQRGSVEAALGYPSALQLLVDVVLLTLLLQNFTGASARIGNAPFWTLALEEQLYMLYFPFLWLRRRLGWARTVLVVLAVSLVWRAVATWATGGRTEEIVLRLGPSRWIEWVLGAIAVEAYVGMVRLPRWCSSAGIAAALLAVAVAVQQLSAITDLALVIDDLAFGMAFFVLLNASVQAEEWAADRSFVRLLAWFGLWSYSLYLVQAPVIVFAKQLALRAGMGTLGVVAMRVALSMIAGYLFFLLIERRFLTRRSSAPPRTATALAST